MQWDDNGNLCFRARQGEYFYWTENNSMQGYYNHKTNTAAFYRYDAGSTRDLKMTAKVTDVNVNGHQTKMPVFTDATLYAGNLMTVDKNGYTKHYFAGTERILASVAGGGSPNIAPTAKLEPIYPKLDVLLEDFTTFAEDYFVDINDNACQKNGIELPAEMGNLPPLGKIFERAIQQNVQDRLYYFNSDHLSSASLITNSAGQTYQTLAYCVYGTPLIDLYSGDYDVENKYTGQIFDEENGMYLFGIRHFNPLDNITPTTDQHWYNYPHISSYNQQGWCPTMFVDPTGMEIEATDVQSQSNIKNTLTQQEAQYVRFDENGKLDTKLLNESKNTSINMIALKVLANSKTTYSFSVRDKDFERKEFYDNGDTDMYRGVTATPNGVHPSPDNKVHILVGNSLSEKQQVMTTAHEAYGHALFYETNQRFGIVNYYHTYKPYVYEVWYEELQMYGPESMKVPTNTLLEIIIKIVTKQAKNNYENRKK